MADAKISDLTELAEAPAAGDLIVLVDVSDTTQAASGTTKRITSTNVLSAAALLAGRSGGQTINGDTASGGNLRLDSTAHATKGQVQFNGTTTYFDSTGSLGVPNGAVGTPSIFKTGAGNPAGIYFLSGQVNLSGNGVAAGTFNAAAATLPGTLTGNGNIMGFSRQVVTVGTSTLTANLRERMYYNTGATTLTLPTAAAGDRFAFAVDHASAFRIQANTGDNIRVMGSVTALAGYIESSTVGSIVYLEAINATTWLAFSIHGVWTDGTFTYNDTGLIT